MIKLRCKVCGRSWVPRIENPKTCPKCKSTRWNDPSISGTFIRSKVKEEILELLKNGPKFIGQIRRRLNYKHPIISFILSEMEGEDKTIISNLEISLVPTKTRKGHASTKVVLREMQMETPPLSLKKCGVCQGYGIKRTIVGSYYWANECLLCGDISDKVFDEELKETFDTWTKNLKELKEQIDREGIEAVFGDPFKKAVKT